MLLPRGLFSRNALLVQRNRAPVQITPLPVTPRELEDRGCEVRVSGHDICFSSCGYTGASDYEGDVDILFETALFSGVEPMLGDVVPVVRGVQDISIFQDTEI